MANPPAERRVFRLRGHEVSRLEAFSDAVFGFAATLLVVSLEVPRTYPELIQSLRGFVGFGLSFAVLLMMWVAHNGFFRRYGLQDGWTVAINSVLLFLILFYVYPLKFLFTSLVGRFLGIDSGGRIRSVAELRSVMLIYGLGFVAVFACLVLLYLHAWRRRDELDLDELEQHEARLWTRHYLIYVGVGLLSVLLAWLDVGVFYGLPGMVFFLLGPLCWWNGWLGERRQKELAQRLAGAEPLPSALPPPA